MKTNQLFGGGMDRIPNGAFRAMALWFRIYDRFRARAGAFERKLAHFQILPGSVVVDYGCGPGGYLSSASSLVGPGGLVYAVDVHPLAIAEVRKKINRQGWSNVIPVVAEAYDTGLEANSVDLIYAWDMFHMLGRPEAFLEECRRLLKPEGRLVLDDGHQPRSVTRQKIVDSGCFDIETEVDDHLLCRPAEETPAASLN